MKRTTSLTKLTGNVKIRMDLGRLRILPEIYEFSIVGEGKWF